MRPLLTSLALLAALLPGATGAQEPAPSPSPSPSPEATPSPPAEVRSEDAAAKAATAEPEDEGGEVYRITAETQGSKGGHSWGRGFVDLQFGELRVQADAMDIYEIERPDGGTGRRLVAEGNVVFLRGEERLAGDHLTMELDTGKGVFRNAVGYLQPGVFVEAKTIERVDADTYRITGGKFTSCAQPNPRWGFTASSATIHVDDKIVARNVLFKVKSVPALYIPYFLYPIRRDQRSTGLLFPHFGYSSARGFNVGTGFFWAMGRSLDQTFYVDQYSKFGYGLGHELRYMREAPSRGTFRTYAFRPKAGGEWDYDVDWNAVQMLPGRFRASLVVRQYSNLLFQQRFQDSLNLATTRTKRASLNVQRSFGATTFQALADANDTFFPGEVTRVNRHLPTLRLARSATKIGRTGIVLSYEARAENLARGDQDRVDTYTRLDVYPELSRPFATSYLQVTPRVQLRYTRYGRTVRQDEETGEEIVRGPALDRPYFQSDVELRGPTFSRVFNNPGGFYSTRFKHVIGPEITWRYRTAVDDFDLIPKFDGHDYLLGTHQIDYALVQRLLAKRPGPSGKLVPHEFLNWRIAQTYYVQINRGQNEFDPNYSSAAFGPGGAPDHNSPVLSRIRFRPTGRFSSNFDLEYDVNFKQLRTLGLSATLNHPRVSLQAGWSRATRTAVKEENRVRLRDTLRGSGTLELVPGKLKLDGALDYDLLRKNLVHSRARVRYDVQCCGFMVEILQFDLGSRTERQFRFSIELENIGSIGNFMGEDPEKAGSFGMPR